jgi:hypothetical protein
LAAIVAADRAFPVAVAGSRRHHALMKNLRSIHLYLGCIFAPLLLFFAISGIWQTLGFHSDFLTRLSTIHTSHQLKNGSSLSGGLLMIFVIIMAVSFVITTILGVIMAIKHGGSRRAAYYCIAFGLAFPIALVLIRALGMRI